MLLWQTSPQADPDNQDWFYRHVKSSRAILCHKVRKSRSLYIYILCSRFLSAFSFWHMVLSKTIFKQNNFTHTWVCKWCYSPPLARMNARIMAMKEALQSPLISSKKKPIQPDTKYQCELKVSQYFGSTGYFAAHTSGDGSSSSRGRYSPWLSSIVVVGVLTRHALLKVWFDSLGFMAYQPLLVI